MPEDMSEYMPEDMPDRMPEDMSDRVPEDMPNRMPEDLPDRMPEDMPEDMTDHMPEDMPDRMSNRMSEDMSDRMPEDLPVRKCINVMVGITRSKVILFFGQNGLKCDSMWNYRRLTRKLHFPHMPENVIPGDFSQKKTRKKNEKNVSFTENEDLWNAQIFDSMCTSPAVECDGVAGVRMRRILSMPCVAGIETT